MNTLKSYFLSSLFLIPIISLAQFDYTKKLSGISIKVGFSNSINDVANSTINPNHYLSGAFGAYRYFNVVTKNEPLFPFHYLKAELNIGSRTGLFTINDLNQTAAIRSNYFEIALIAPLTWEITDHITANIGVGGAIGFVRSINSFSNINPTPIVREGDAIKGSIMIDYHFLFVGKSNGIIGSRVVLEPSKYSYAEWSFYLGFGLPKSKKLKK